MIKLKGLLKEGSDDLWLHILDLLHRNVTNRMEYSKGLMILNRAMPTMPSGMADAIMNVFFNFRNDERWLKSGKTDAAHAISNIVNDKKFKR